jgi:hypothetical protein
VVGPNSAANLGPQRPDYTFDQAKKALLSIVNRFGLHIAKEVLTWLGEDKLSSDAPNWMFAEVVRFSKLEASTADEFWAALTLESVEFLEKLRPGGPWVLTAIEPDGKPTTLTANNPGEARDFIRAHNGRRNIYYSVNPTRTPMTAKPAKTDVGAIEHVLADLDPVQSESSADAKARYVAELETFEPRPTFVIDSGNGIQLLWRLTAPIVLGKPMPGEAGRLSYSPEDQAKIDQAEARSAAVMGQLNAKAGTQNIDRILRLPGTINLPNAKKKREGRVVCPTNLINFNDVSHSLDVFPFPTEGARQQKAKHGNSSNAEASLDDLDNLPDVDIAHLPISNEIRQAIDTDGSEIGGGDRSRGAARITCELVRANCTDQQIASVLWHRPISAHFREQANPNRAIQRVIAFAKGEVAKNSSASQFDAVDLDVFKLNETYALIIVGGKTVILKETPHEAGGYTLLSHSAFDHWFANRYVVRDKKRMTLSRYWMSHPDRRHYEGVIFAPGRDVPGYYNLWRGFAVAPAPGDCSKFLAHILHNICQGNQDLFNWLIGWFAQLVQQPEVKLGTAVVLRGKEGTGKSIVGKTFGSLLGPHYVPVSKPELVTGRFNGHLSNCLLLQAEEAFWAGDRAAAGALKDLITNDDFVVEFKGLEAIRMRNYVRLFATSNEDWVVPAGPTARRFAVFDVGEAHLGDKAYFRAIAHELDNGGREALLDYLLNFDLSKVDLRSVPKTKALLEQKLHSLDGEQAWWFGVLMHGELPGNINEPRCCRTQTLFNHYRDETNRAGIKRKRIETLIGTFLNRHVPGLRRREKRGDGFIYEFPPLAECRAAFEALIQQEIDWPEQDDWRAETPSNPFSV